MVGIFCFLSSKLCAFVDTFAEIPAYNIFNTYNFSNRRSSLTCDVVFLLERVQSS
ncbi:hypothetical protein KP509_25G010000 [Ceratopteris richardii]|uniref:Uncharacterized protein n=1 Tax=Ceratopteris richardii TaxID=49495 RepID=A0A8T2RNT9_CERRI|nr:hypothetical protein KP509_25G009900 [Ceratopteris richardii]KAH7297741.1 hypothetical protein KP509_25G010000 [Ceratopteris richardii]